MLGAKQMRVLLNLYTSTSAESDQSETRLDAARKHCSPALPCDVKSELAAFVKTLAKAQNRFRASSTGPED